MQKYFYKRFCGYIADKIESLENRMGAAGKRACQLGALGLLLPLFSGCGAWDSPIFTQKPTQSAPNSRIVTLKGTVYDDINAPGYGSRLAERTQKQGANVCAVPSENASYIAKQNLEKHCQISDANGNYLIEVPLTESDSGELVVSVDLDADGKIDETTFVPKENIGQHGEVTVDDVVVTELNKYPVKYGVSTTAWAEGLVFDETANLYKLKIGLCNGTDFTLNPVMNYSTGAAIDMDNLISIPSGECSALEAKIKSTSIQTIVKIGATDDNGNEYSLGSKTLNTPIYDSTVQEPTPIVVEPIPTVTASVDKNSAYTDEDVTLTCTTTGNVSSLGVRCDVNDSWSIIAQGNTAVCSYPNESSYTPGCRINNETIDNLVTPISIALREVSEIEYILDKASCPFVRVEHGTAVLGSKIYFIAGADNINDTNTAEVYDVDTNICLPIASLSTPRNGLAVALVNEKIYAFGGYSPGANSQNSAEVYDPANNSWSPIANLPHTWSNMLPGVYNGKIYLVTGETHAESYISDVYEYDPEKDTYTAKTPIPVPQSKAAFTVYGSELYLFGGRTTGNVPIYAIRSYNMATDEWSDHGVFPADASEASIAQFNNKFYMFAFANNITNIYSFDPATDNVSLTSFNIPVAKGTASGAMHNGKFYLRGGNNSNTCFNSIDEIVFK